jgi:hypothetical protein
MQSVGLMRTAGQFAVFCAVVFSKKEVKIHTYKYKPHTTYKIYLSQRSINQRRIVYESKVV